MRIYRTSLNFQLLSPQGPVSRVSAPTAITIGVFDGVHLGHRHLLCQLATNPGLALLPVVLSTHPVFLFGHRQAEQWLVEPHEQAELLFQAGADYVACLEFDMATAALSACQMTTALHEQFNMRTLLLGYDSRFGNRTHDDFDRLPELANRLGFSLQRATPCLVADRPVSSSRIRQCLLDGAVDEAASLLGYPYSLCGRVVHGRGVGHTLGFPTANIHLNGSRKMLPAAGVYAVTLNGMPAVANLGAAPTYGITTPLLEVHVLDFEGDLYGSQAEVAFLHHLRPIQHFDSPQALQQALKHDITQAQQWF